MQRIGTIVSAVVVGTLITGGALAKDKKGKEEPAPEPAPAAEEAAAEEGRAAEGDPALTGVVEYRHIAMESLGDHMGAIKRIVKGEVDRMDDLPWHAAALQGAARDLPGLFPAGTGPDAFETRALPEIWASPDDFAKAAEAYATATATLVEVAGGGDQAAAMDAFGAVGKSCGGCHKPFRAEEHQP